MYVLLHLQAEVRTAISIEPHPDTITEAGNYEYYDSVMNSLGGWGLYVVCSID